MRKFPTKSGYLPEFAPSHCTHVQRMLHVKAITTMKKPVTILIAMLFFVLCGNAQSKIEEVCYNPNQVGDTSKKSIKSQAFALLGTDSIRINYHSPGVRSRIIWGGLVPYDEVWVTGAHQATNLQIDKPFVVAGKQIPAGKYALFTIPGKKSWTIILNRHWNQHLTNEYDAKDDVVRITVKPKKVKHTERLQYFVQPAGTEKAVIAMAWEKVSVSFPIWIQP